MKIISPDRGPSINYVGNWEWRGGKDWSKQPIDSTKKTTDMGKGCFKNPEKMPMSFMGGPKPKTSTYIKCV